MVKNIIFCVNFNYMFTFEAGIIKGYPLLWHSFGVHTDFIWFPNSSTRLTELTIKGYTSITTIQIKKPKHFMSAASQLFSQVSNIPNILLQFNHNKI